MKKTKRNTSFSVLQNEVEKPDIVFIQQFPMTYFGVIVLDGHLKQAGYRADVIIEAFEEDLIETLRSLDPKIIGFSVFSTEHEWLIKITKQIHREFPNIKIIVGGVHAMVYPEIILSDTDTHLVCYCDGEEVLSEVLKQLQNSKADWSSVDGIAYKTERGEIRKNPKKSFAQYKDDLIEDRDIYFNKYPSLRKDSIGYFMSSRGCPYSCSFCYNNYLRNSLGKKGYLRRKSVGNFIQELLITLDKYESPSVFFIDDLFISDRAWLRKFLPLYKKKIGLPFACTTNAKLLNEETAKMLADAGCQSASFGIETGNERLRREVLNKPISNQEMIACGTLLKKHDISVRASSIFCLPDETVQDALETVDLNIKCKVDLAASMLLLPYPGTGITNYAIKKKVISETFSLHDVPKVAYKTSVLNMPDKKKIVNIHFLLFYFVRYPYLYRIFRRSIYIEELNALFYLLFILGCFIRNKDENGLTWHKAFLYAWSKRRLLLASKKSKSKE